MKEIKLKGKVIYFYDNIKDMPIRRYQQANKYLMIATDIGSSFEDFDVRTYRVSEFISKGMNKEALSELENRRMTIYNAFDNFIPEGYALALFVHSINGIEKNDITDEGLDRTLDELSNLGLTKSNLDEILNDVKKKSEGN